MVFGSIFSGESDNADQIKHRKAVLNFNTKFEVEEDNFFEYMDDLRNHYEATGLKRSGIVTGDIIPNAEGGNGFNRREYIIFDDFGIITDEMIE